VYVYPTSFFKVLNKGVKRGVMCVEGREADTGVVMWDVRIGGRWMRRFVRGVMGARSAVALSCCSGSGVDVEMDREGEGRAWASSSSSTLLISLGDSFCAFDALGLSSSSPSSSCRILYFLFSLPSFPSLVPVTPCISLPLIILLTLSHAASTSATSNPATIALCVPVYEPSLIRACIYVFSKLYARSGWLGVRDERVNRA